MYEEKPYNQRMYLRARGKKINCKKCRKQIIWMRTVDGRNVAVDPLKVINTTPGVPILDEEGITLVNIDRKVGWHFHECKDKNSGRNSKHRRSLQLRQGAGGQIAQNAG